MRLKGVIAMAAAGIAVLSFQTLPLKAALLSFLLGSAMLAIAVIDARRFTIPDILSLPAIALGLLASGVALDPSLGYLASTDHVIGALLGGGALWLVREVYLRFRGREGLGMGDIKLAAAAGAWIGWQHLAVVILLAAATALAFVSAKAIVQRKCLSGTDRIPFGAFLAPSIWVVWSFREVARGHY